MISCQMATLCGIGLRLRFSLSKVVRESREWRSRRIAPTRIWGTPFFSNMVPVLPMSAAAAPLGCCCGNDDDNGSDDDEDEDDDNDEDDDDNEEEERGLEERGPRR